MGHRRQRRRSPKGPAPLREPCRAGSTRVEPGRAGSSEARSRAQSSAAALAMADLRLAAWFLWITPLLTALSSFLAAARSASFAASLSPEAAASRKERTLVFSADLTDLLRKRR